MRLKDISVGVFAKIVNDSILLDLLGVPSTDMEDIKYQIVEDKYPNDLVVDNLSRLCVYETPTSTPIFSNIERSYIEIDIFVTKENNKIDRRILLIANRLYDLFHKSNIEGYDIKYYNRLPNLPTDNNEWVKYGIVFNYDNIIL